MERNDVKTMKSILGPSGYEDMASLLDVYRKKYPEKIATIHLAKDKRKLTDVLLARQTFRIEGYEAGHCFTIERGDLKNLRSCFVFGGLEISR